MQPGPDRSLSQLKFSTTAILYMHFVVLVTSVLTHVFQTPTNLASQKLTVQLPIGTKCTGGAGKNICVASFITTAGFGNCVAVSQTTHVRSGAGEEKKKGKGKMGDKVQGIMADKRQGSESSVSLPCHPWI